MNIEQISLVKRSWKIISKINPVLVGDVFYTKLFLEHPELKLLFKSSREEQAQKLVNMLDTMITSLDRLDGLKEDIRQLGIRHRKYGVSFKDYQPVGNALIWTIEHALGSDFDEHTRDAWAQCYAELSDAMQSV